jgi:hypothetical protein
MAITRNIQTLLNRRNGQKIVAFKVSGGQFTREGIEREVRRIAQRQPNKEFQILLPYETWKPGSWFGANKPISTFRLEDHYDESELPDRDEPENFDSFIINIGTIPPRAGGCRAGNDDGLNDCLWHCLLQGYGTRSRLPKAIKSPEALKETLGLARSTKIPIKSIPQIESLAGTISINVSGDYSYISQKKCERQLNLILANGHYSIAKNPERKVHKRWHSKAKNILVYKEDPFNGVVHFYDGKSRHTNSAEKLKELRAKRWSGEWCLVSVQKDKATGVWETLEEAYRRFDEEATALLEKTQKIGLPIDLRMCGGSYKVASLWVFERMSRGLRANKPLSPQEALWISKAMKGGIIWGEKGWKGYGNQYDFTSMYPSLMKKSTWPIGAGDFRTVEDFAYKRAGTQMYYYGIFRAKVEFREEMVKLFRFNSENFYTHIDLRRAWELGLRIELLKDGAPNALIYEKKKGHMVSGEVMFGAIVDFLFRIKSEGGPAGRASKRILNTLWGALSERKKSYYEIDTSTGPADLSDASEEEIVDTIIPIDKDFKRFTVQCRIPSKLFEGEYPRVAPFLLAFGRKMVSEAIEPYATHLKRVHTDGFILGRETNHSAEASLPKISENASTILGSLKHEKEGQCVVKNSMRVNWD